MKKNLLITIISVFLLLSINYNHTAAKTSITKSSSTSIKSTSKSSNYNGNTSKSTGANQSKQKSINKTSTPTNESSSSALKKNNSTTTQNNNSNIGSTQKHSGMPYYNSNNNSFSKKLMTAAGMYLILDYITEAGEPVYISAETGEKADYEEFSQASPIDEDTIPLTEQEIQKAIQKTTNYYELILKGNYGSAIRELLLSEPSMEEVIIPETYRNEYEQQEVTKQITAFYTSSGNAVSSYEITGYKVINDKSLLFSINLTDSNNIKYTERIVAITEQGNWYLTFDLVESAVNLLLDNTELSPSEAVNKYYSAIIDANYGEASSLVSKNQSFTEGKTDEEIKNVLIDAFNKNEYPLQKIEVLEEKKLDDNSYIFSINLIHLEPGFIEEVEVTNEVMITLIKEAGIWKLHFDDVEEKEKDVTFPLNFDFIKVFIHILIIAFLLLSIILILGWSFEDREKYKKILTAGRK